MARAKQAKTETGTLRAYRAKRDFKKTPEPAGKRGARRAGRQYLVQKHAARRLHYDFRLELDGVLKSWAVTKGPSLNPADRRLAVHVEDHPLEYGDFEGVIPRGQYGGGTVMLWDRGTWEPVGDVRESYEAGKLKFRLRGERLSGGWTLVRMGGRAARERGDNWLLIKERDDEAVAEDGDALLREANTSVLSGRSMDEIARDKDRIWTSEGEDPAAKKSRARRAKPRAAKLSFDPPELKKARSAPLPEFVPPQLATLVARPPKDHRWLHEIKFDGYRTLCRVEAGEVRFLTRKGLDWTARFGRLARAAAALPVDDAMLDGEIVVVQPGGVTDFPALQDALSAGRDQDLVYYAFDLLHLNGRDLTQVPLADRKDVLRQLLEAAGERVENFTYSDHVEAKGAQFFESACRFALEGTISKRRDASYRPGRGRDWVKTKCVERQEFVIGGFTEPTTKSRGIGALLLGAYQGRDLTYVGRCGTGFTDKASRSLRSRLDPLRRDKPPFKQIPTAARKGARWVAPELVCEVEFGSWTADRILRHAAFKGLREDKDPDSVIIERPAISEGKTVPSKSRDHAGGDTVAGVRLSHPDRVLYAEQGLTKRGLADYYIDVAEVMLPHVAGRPLSLVRCPSGQDKECFYQKHAGTGIPEAIRRVPIREKEGKATYLAIDDVAGLVSLVQVGVLEIHPWGARLDDIERPDRLIFDLDPDPGLPFDRVKDAALEVRDRLSELRLKSFLKSSGGKGLHVVLPVVRRHEWGEAKAFSKALAEAMRRDTPKLFTATVSKSARRGKIFIDYLRNDRGATAVAPYSTRARAGAPVSVPLEWDELPAIAASDQFTVANVRRRLAAQKRDPWADMPRVRQSLTDRALRALGFKA